MLKADKLMADVGGANYKTDNMIVVVKKDNPASNLMDASDVSLWYTDCCRPGKYTDNAR